MTADLTTTELAELTGVRPATLRMWETRYGFPVALRGAGRRRYSSGETDSVLEVLALRAAGLSLPAAIARARASGSPPPPSIFAALREARPELQPAVLGKRDVLALTRAIEDEYCARASAGVLYASFQRVDFYRRSERRWRELARSARLAFVIADFPAVHTPPGGPIEVPIAHRHPLAREWTLVIDAPGVKACIAAWERPESAEVPDPQRRFELLWSYEPAVVAIASGIASRLVATAAPQLADTLPDPAAADSPVSAAPELRFASALSHRIVDYLTAPARG
jgi:DICT domain-containing protein